MLRLPQNEIEDDNLPRRDGPLSLLAWLLSACCCAAIWTLAVIGTVRFFRS